MFVQVILLQCSLLQPFRVEASSVQRWWGVWWSMWTSYCYLKAGWRSHKVNMHEFYVMCEWMAYLFTHAGSCVTNYQHHTWCRESVICKCFSECCKTSTILSHMNWHAWVIIHEWKCNNECRARNMVLISIALHIKCLQNEFRRQFGFLQLRSQLLVCVCV